MSIITEQEGTLNVAEHLNVGRDTNVRGNLTVTGDLRVEGITTLLNANVSDSADGPASGGVGLETFEQLRSALEEERTLRQNADTTINTNLGIVKMDAASAQNMARQALTQAGEAAQMATDAASAVNAAEARMEKMAGDIRRDLDWWIFPVKGGEKAVSTDGVSSVNFTKEGFYLRAGGKTYHIAPPLSASASYRFAFGETAWLAINAERLFKLMPDQNISVSQVMEKVTDISAVTSGSHIPVAFGHNGEVVRLTARFAEIFS